MTSLSTEWTCTNLKYAHTSTKSKLKILLVAKTFSRTSGGVENHIYNLVEQLKKRHDFTIITSDEHKDVLPGAKIIRLPMSFRVMNYIYSRQMKKYLSDIMMSVDIVHCHNYCCYYVDTAARMAKKCNKPLVITNHGVFPSRNSITAVFMAAYNTLIGVNTWRLADKIISVSNFSRNRIIEIGAPEGNNVVIHNGISLREFRVKGNRKQFLKPDEKMIIYAGRIVKEKGLGFLIDAFKEATSIRRCKLFVAGDDTTAYADEMKRKTNSLGLKSVVFLGKMDRTSLVRLYKSGDLFALPSAYEPFGIVLLEAMAAGLPIVASKVGGVPEILAGTGNLMVCHGDTKGFAKAMLRILGNREIGKSNMKHVQKFTISAMAEKTDKIYREVTRNQRPR